MITDVIDDTEVKTGLLTIIGYQSATTAGEVIVQTEAVKQGIYNLACLVPTIGFILLALTLIFLYPLSKKRVDENAAILSNK